MPDRVELELHTEIADGLGRFDKRPTDVVISDQTQTKGDADFVGVAEGGSDAGVWHRDDDVAVGRMFFSEETAHPFAGLLDRSTEDKRIRAGEIDVFKDAMGFVAAGRPLFAGDAFRTNDDHFAGFDFALIDSIDEVEGTGFGGEDVADFVLGDLHLAHGEGPEAMGVAGNDDTIFGEKNERKCAFELQESFAEGGGEGPLAGFGDEMENYFGIARGLKDGAFGFEGWALSALESPVVE